MKQLRYLLNVIMGFTLIYSLNGLSSFTAQAGQGPSCAALMGGNPAPKLGSKRNETDARQLISQVEEATAIDIDSVTQIIKSQDQVESFLSQRLKHVIETNAPPKAWGEYIDELPASVRRQFTRNLLDHNSQNQDRIVQIISEINPSEGGKDAVISFLSTFLETHSLSDQQIKTMFSSSERFNRFFDTDISKDAKVSAFQLTLAVKTHEAISPHEALTSQSINPDLAPNAKYRQKRDIEQEDKLHFANREELKSILGFSPIRVPKHLQDQIQAGFKGQGMPSDLADQVRGVVVQGAYNRDGFILTEKLGTRRGMAQVEKDVPGMIKALKESLAGGTLSRLSELDQRLFVDNWSLNSNPGLIKSIRQRALVVAQMDPAFTSLRVEIHAFPNADVLYRTKKYVENYRKNKPNAKTLTEYQTLIKEIEDLINPSSSAGSINALISEKIRADGTIRKSLEEVSQNFEKLPSYEKMLVLLKIRQLWKEQRLANPSRESKFFYFLGDRQLADMVIAEAAKVVNTLSKQSDRQLYEVSNYAWTLLDHIGMDNMLNTNQILSVKREIYDIYHDQGLSNDKKLELVSNLLSNSVDQVYYLLKRNYGEFDERILRLVTRGADRPPVRFVDGTLRSNTVFMLSQLVDTIETSAMKRKNISHHLNGKKLALNGQVFNPGEADGIIRINANPLELTSEEIGVFSEMPIESGAINGIITLGVGARLSHLQLLAKALQIPNVKFSPEALKVLEPFEGKRVHLVANKDGSIKIQEIKGGQSAAPQQMAKIEVPLPDYRLEKPISFAKGTPYQDYIIAGPKGMVLMKLFNDRSIGESVPDGFILPFGFYRRYLKSTGIAEVVDQLAQVKIENTQLIAFLTAKIRKHFESNPLPNKMLQEVMNELTQLQKRTGHKGGYFFRSDTNIEDLPGFNGAGLNESVANVKMDQVQVDEAIRVVWASAFKEKSIMWRARALNATTVPVADPSEVVLPTVYAMSSGVILSRGGDNFAAGKGMISSNWGIGSVVEAGAPTEEINLEGFRFHRYSLTSSNVKPTADAKGGLKMVAVQPGLAVLNESQINELVAKANLIEKILGNQPKGWDIEWAVNERNEVIILQARPVN